MLIGIDASRAAVPQRTGTENYSLYLIRALLGEGREHRFRLYFNHPPAEALFERSERVEWRVMPLSRLWTHLRLAWEVIVHPPDVLYVPAHVIPLLHPRCCVATVHDLGYLHYPQAHTRRARWYLDWSTRWNARVAQRVIVDSEATRRDLEAHYGVERAKLVLAYPAGAEGFAPVKDAAALDAARNKYATGQHYFLYVGTLHPRKNLTTLLHAFDTLIREKRIGEEVKLVLAGKPGWLYDEILALARADRLRERVVLLGYVAPQDLPALLSGALAFVLPSWYEGFGLPILEAMACETPVICSNVSSLPEVAGDAALLVDPRDVHGWADAMQRFAQDEVLRQTLIERGRERARHFTWQRCAQQVLQALEDAAAEVGRGRRVS